MIHLRTLLAYGAVPLVLAAVLFVSVDVPVSELAKESELTPPEVRKITLRMPAGGLLARHILDADREGEDIYYYWHRGGQIAAGDNPYVCSLDNTCIEKKNPGHLPLFYWMSAAVRSAGFVEFEDWMAFWEPVFVAAWLGIGAVIFTLIAPAGILFAWIGTLFWLFNRWSLYVLNVGQIDFLALLSLLLALLFLPRRRWLAMVLFGTSLAFKQVAIFLVPLFIVHSWIETKGNWKQVARDTALLAAVPLIVSFPFITDNLPAFIRGLTFSVTRTNQANFGAPSVNAIVAMSGWQGAALMGALMIGVCVLLWQRAVSFVSATALIMIIFLGFNTVLFNQYFIWPLSLAIIALAQGYVKKQPKKPVSTGK